MVCWPRLACDLPALTIDLGQSLDAWPNKSKRKVKLSSMKSRAIGRSFGVILAG